MSIVRKVFFYVSLICGVLLIIITAASLMYSSSLWFLKVLNFPRLAVLIALVICLLVFGFSFKKLNLRSSVFIFFTAASILIQAYILFPYTPVARQAVESANINEVDTGSVISIIVANVYMKNRHAEELLHIIANKNPTFVQTMEVNTWWVNQLSKLHKHYPYRITFPTNNSYGMSLYSKLALKDTKIYFLNHDSVPSFYTTVTLPNENQFQLFTIHPVAPKPSDHPDNIKEKEVALINAAHIVSDVLLPVIVAGDFNDVGWSRNSKQFELISKLNDVRFGRGLYNTFTAQSMIFRWPLDYVYVSKEFKVLNVERLQPFGSDHFPYYVQLALYP